jgi:hypothetical protein
VFGILQSLKVNWKIIEKLSFGGIKDLWSYVDHFQHLMKNSKSTGAYLDVERSKSEISSMNYKYVH